MEANFIIFIPFFITSIVVFGFIFKAVFSKRGRPSGLSSDLKSDLLNQLKEEGSAVSKIVSSGIVSSGTISSDTWLSDSGSFHTDSSNSGNSLSIEERISQDKVWSSGTIPSSGAFLPIAMWLVTVVWMLTFGVSFYKFISTPDFKTGPAIMLGVFSCLGIVPLIFAIMLTIREFRFGRSHCLINGKAGVLGETLKGVVRTKMELAPEGEYIFELKCLETYYIGSGKNRRSQLVMHFADTKKVESPGKNSVMGVPFKFDLPENLPETGSKQSRGTIQWQLSMGASVKGVNYLGLFTIPVFKR